MCHSELIWVPYRSAHLYRRPRGSVCLGFGRADDLRNRTRPPPIPLPAGKRWAQVSILPDNVTSRDSLGTRIRMAVAVQVPCQDEWRAPLRRPGDARPETKPRARRGFGVTTIDFRTDPVTARRRRVVSLVIHADIPDIVWADDETGCYGVRGGDVKGNRIVVQYTLPPPS